MSILIGNRPALAVGHNNKVGYVIFDWTTNDVIYKYMRPSELLFTPYERLELSDSRQSIPIGLAKATWKYAFWNDEALKLWTSLFLPNGGQSAPVTLRTLDTHRSLWYDYNAFVKNPDFNSFYQQNGYADVAVEFYDLRPIT